MKWPAIICPDQIGGTAENPVLLGNHCRNCGERFFPAARGCTRCSSVDLVACELGSTGVLWSWTIQMFQPKAPYDVNEAPGSFKPYGVGYIQLENGLKIESRLLAKGKPSFVIGQPMRLVLEAYRQDGAGLPVYTYAFEAVA